MTQYKPGDLIGKKYLVERPPLRGGMGIVYLCYDTVTGDPIALKTFQKRLLSASAIERFREEALTWVKLDKHPHIVRCYWMQELDYQPFIGMEMVPSSEELSADLGDWIRQRRLSLATILSFAIQICRGMQHAHAKLSLVHCDLKPSNILVTQNLNVKVTDFGLARAIQVMGSDALTDAPAALAINPHSLGVHRGVAGTPPYMPPEQWRAEPLDVRADIYAFGCVLYEMMTGRPPFEVHFMPNSPQRVDEWLRAWQSQHEETPPPALPSTLPDGLEEVVHSCLAKERSARFSDFEAIEAALATLYQLVTGRGYAALPPIARLTAWELKDKGGSLNNLGRPKEALVVLDQAIAIDPDVADAWLNKGASLGMLERHAEALAAFNQALVLDPAWALAWANKGRSLDALGRLEEALAAYDRALAIDPNFTIALVNKGGSLVDLGRLEEALATYDQALAVDLAYAPALYNKGVVLNRLGKTEQALAAYERAVMLNPDLAHAWCNKGIALAHLGRYEQALAAFDQALAIDSGLIQAWFNQGLSMAALQRNEEALVAFNQVVMIDPDHDEAWFRKGVHLFRVERYEDALTAFERVLAIEPDRADGWFNKAAALERLERNEEAQNAHRKALSMARNGYDEGVSLGSAGRWKEALAIFNQVLAIVPNHAPVWYNKGVSLAALGRYEEAIVAYDRVLAIDPAYTSALINKSMSLEALGRYEEVLTTCDQALAIDPALALAWYNKGVSFSALKRWEEALAAYDQSLAINPHDPKAWFNLGSCLRFLGREDEALTAYEQALAIDPAYAIAYFSIGDLLIDHGALREALSHFEKAAQFGFPQAEQRTAHIKQMLTRAVQFASAAFQDANSIDEMRSAVAQFPFMADAKFIQAVEQLIREETAPEHHAAFEQRLAWLCQIADEQNSRNIQ